jgi:hypothetical protein
MKLTWKMGIVIAVAIALMTAPLVLADNVQNDVVAGGNDTMTAGGSTTVPYRITANNGDGQTGCNAADSSAATVTIIAPAAVTATPSSLSFTNCGTDKPVVFSSSVAGDYDITVSVSDSGTGTYNTNPAKFTLHVLAAPPTNTPPTVAVTGVEDGETYNKGSVPAAMCNVTDAEDGNSSFAATLSAITGPYASDGIGSQTASCSYTDAGGLTAEDSASYTIVDPSAPVIGYVLSPAAPDGSNGWYVSDVTLAWTVTENESPNSLVKTGCDDQNITADQAETPYSCSATSAGGSAGPVSVSIKRDATAPSVALDGGPADGASYYFGSVPAAPTCSASDATSGLAGPCSVSGYDTAVGSHTVTASASDNAGNSSSASVTYTVLAWTLNGFYQPVDMNDVFNVVKNGNTVPLKFEVFAGATELTNTEVVKSFVQTKITCDGSAPQDDIEITTTGGTSLRYDVPGGQFIQNWQTPRAAGSCYRVTMTTQDGSSLVAFFKLK